MNLKQSVFGWHLNVHSGKGQNRLSIKKKSTRIEPNGIAVFRIQEKKEKTAKKK